MAAVDAAAAEARAEAGDAVKLVEPAVERAREESAALEQVARYREFLDLVARGQALEQRLLDWGADGVQAYFIRSGEERYGPFQFEEIVQLEMQNVLVRSTMRGAIQVFDADTEMPLGKAADGQVTVTIGQKRREIDAGTDPDALDEGQGSEAAQASARRANARVHRRRSRMTGRPSRIR